jgi:hypothetical protein
MLTCITCRTDDIHFSPTTLHPRRHRLGEMIANNNSRSLISVNLRYLIIFPSGAYPTSYCDVVLVAGFYAGLMLLSLLIL